MPSVSIAIQPNIFDRFSDLNFKPSQAIAEFIDNAIQSYLDYKNNSTFYHNGYKLTIDLTIEWGESVDHKTYAKSIIIRDNAAGMALPKYEKAFETGRRPAFNEGLNEYGMGMKTAACWLSKQWTIISKSFSEDVERTLSFDVDDIVSNRRTSLEFIEKNIPGNQSYTEVRLEKLHRKNNFTKRMLSGIKYELSSIYRAFLRRGEIQINIHSEGNSEALLFNDPKILVAPYYENTNGQNIEWKKQISEDVFGKEINGFIGILSEMSEKQSGLVIMRRGRVIVGESSDHLYHPESLFGTYKNGFRYKRLYGEIEIKGFSASFNKNGFSDMEELEEMLGMQRTKLSVDGYSLLKQADNLRVKPKPVKPKPVVNTYTIKWKFDNGTADKIETYQASSSLNFPLTPQKSGHSFIEWKPTPQSIVTTNAEYVAQWKPTGATPKPTTVNIRWCFNNGQIDKLELYEPGEKIVIPSNPSKAGHEFVGWSPAPSLVASNDATYSAQWKMTQSTSQNDSIATKVFSFNGATARMDLVKSETYDALLSLDLEKFSSESIIKGYINLNKLPVVDKTLSNNDVKNLLLSMAVAMFEAQMNGEDSCEGLIKYMK